MSMSYGNRVLHLPPGFKTVLEGLVLEVLRAQPSDVVAFAAQYFQRLVESREASSADPLVRGAQLKGEVAPQPAFQIFLLFLQESEEKEDKEEAGSVASAHTVRDTAPAPKIGLFKPKPAQG